MFNQLFTLLLPMLMAGSCYVLVSQEQHTWSLVFPLLVAALQVRFFSARWKLVHGIILVLVVVANFALSAVWVSVDLLNYRDAYQVTNVALWSLLPAIAYVLLMHDVMFLAQLNTKQQMFFGGAVNTIAWVFAWLTGAGETAVVLLLPSTFLGAVVAPLLLRLFAHTPSKRSPLKAD